MPGHVPLFVVVGGPPGAGQETHCEEIASKFGLVHLSVTSLLQDTVRSGSALGKELETSTSANGGPSDELVGRVVRDAIKRAPGSKKRGWLLDGFPRTPAQALLMPKLGLHPDLFLELNVPETVLKVRASSSRIDPESGVSYNLHKNPPPDDKTIRARLIQSLEDTDEGFQARLDAYHAEASGVRRHLSRVRVEIDGAKEAAEVTRSVLGVCATALQRKISELELPNWLESVGHAAAGGAAGVAAMALIFPIDTIKTRLQLEQPALPPGVSGWPLVRAMYNGLPLGLLETGTVHGTSFLAYEFVKGLWVRARLGRALKPGEEPPIPPFAIHTVLGCIASFFCQTVTLPLKICLVRVQGGKATGLSDAASQVLKESGIRGFYAGLTSNLFLMLNPAVTYILYERLIKLFVTRRRESLSRSPSRPSSPTPAGGSADDGLDDELDVPSTGGDQLIAGFIAKAIATALTFPIQKTQAMVQGVAEYEGSQTRALLSLVRDGGGILALWRGLTPKLFQAALQQSLIFRFKEPWAKIILDAIRASRKVAGP